MASRRHRIFWREFLDGRKIKICAKPIDQALNRPNHYAPIFANLQHYLYVNQFNKAAARPCAKLVAPPPLSRPDPRLAKCAFVCAAWPDAQARQSPTEAPLIPLQICHTTTFRFHRPVIRPDVLRIAHAPADPFDHQHDAAPVASMTGDRRLRSSAAVRSSRAGWQIEEGRAAVAGRLFCPHPPPAEADADGLFNWHSILT